MELTDVIGNSEPHIFNARIRFGIFSAWGVITKFFGLLLVCNQALLMLVGRRWPCWGGFTDKI
jgi:hypothetical protein